MSHNGLNQENQGKWMDKNLLAPGGASFIGSHLVDRFVNLGANLTVVDDFSSGNIENLAESSSRIKFIKKDLECIEKCESRAIFPDNDNISGKKIILNHFILHEFQHRRLIVLIF